jgi:sugar phosphate isomerase/epimerase
LRRYLDLAAELGARYVRAFLGELRPGATYATAQNYIARCLEEAAGHARAIGAGIAVEPHDDFVHLASVAPIFERVTDPAVGAVWDIGNAFAAGDDPAESFPLLGQRIFYVQVKDSLGRFPNRRLTRLGEGEVPLARAFELLMQSGYTGEFSVETERAWHPELDPAGIALPHALTAVQDLLATALVASSARP